MRMARKSKEPKILLDCDVIIHFVKAGKQLLLPKIYPGRFVILDKVKAELDKHRGSLTSISNFIAWSKIPIVPMPRDINIIKEYSLLKKTLGEGEAACMAVARLTNDYIASSNLKDIKQYCELHGIIYMTTMDILLQAYKSGIMGEAECDGFIKEVKDKKSKLIYHIDSIAEYEKLKKR